MLATKVQTDNRSNTSIQAVRDPECTESSDSPSRETIFEILSNYRRRCVLAYLNQNGGTSDLRTLSEQIAGWENDIEVSLISSKQRMRVYTALRQSHLPKMDRLGIVEFDDQSGEVRLTSAAETVEEYMESSDEDSDDLMVYSFGIGGLGLILSLGLYADILVTGGIPDALAGGVVSTVIVIVGLLNLYSSRQASSDISLDKPLT